MPFKNPADRRAYQNARYHKKKEVKKRELDVLDKLGQTLLSRKLTTDEEKIYKVLSEKYDAELHSRRERDQRSTFLADDSDLSLYKEFSRDERIINGEGSEQTTEHIPRLSDAQKSDSFYSNDPIPPTENKPKLRPTSQAKTVIYDEKKGDYVELEEEDAGNVIKSVWKISSIYERS